ncbi:hypothetical protein [Nocardioides flavescens]|uniref:Uncharacterized protein n=1 Tax=Nocardioides flavescens TaxID=2691959 RepID=A0A6L7EV99_9ACTN|nr:hypothetical protein [Nocardioides flavescens]MXG91313.1 hypothetical protein [Nocardioides flavescens]
MAAWGKSREEREREYHEAMAKLEADQAELRQPDDEGAVRYAARSFGESLLVLLGGLVICVVGAAIGAAVAGTLGLFVGFVVGVVICGVLSVIGFGFGAVWWRREYENRR